VEEGEETHSGSKLEKKKTWKIFLIQLQVLFLSILYLITLNLQKEKSEKIQKLFTFS